MSRFDEQNRIQVVTPKNISIGAIAALALVAVSLWGCPQYYVYSADLGGKAELARAENNRQVMVRTSQAKKDAAKFEAEAEVERAKGVAEANKIIGASLNGNESYLRYLWIQTLEHARNSTVVYVPTEANLPILEAGRLPREPAAKPASK